MPWKRVFSVEIGGKHIHLCMFWAMKRLNGPLQKFKTNSKQILHVHNSKPIKLPVQYQTVLPDGTSVPL